MRHYKKLLGYLILASPFVAIFIGSTIRNGFWVTTLAFLCVAALLAFINLGIHLIDND